MASKPVTAIAEQSIESSEQLTAFAEPNKNVHSFSLIKNTHTNSMAAKSIRVISNRTCLTIA